MRVASRSFLVTWSPPSDLNAPEVNYTLQLTQPSSAMNITGVTVQMYLFEELQPSTNYSVVIFAVSDKGPGPASETIAVTTSEDCKCDARVILCQ